MKILVKSQTTFSQQRSCFGINIFSSCVISGYLWNSIMVLDENESAIDEDKIYLNNYLERAVLLYIKL